MDPLIENLKSTTFFGKRLTRRQIADIQETVGLFPKLSRTELGHTICEHLRWQTPKGSNRIHLATRLLEELERLGILTLPAHRRASALLPARPTRAPARLPAVRLRHPQPGVPRHLGVSTKFRTIWAVAAMAVEWSRRSSALHDC